MRLKFINCKGTNKKRMSEMCIDRKARSDLIIFVF